MCSVGRFCEQHSLALSVQHLLWVETNVIVYCKSDGSSTAVCSALLDSDSEEVTCRYLLTFFVDGPVRPLVLKTWKCHRI